MFHTIIYHSSYTIIYHRLCTIHHTPYIFAMHDTYSPFLQHLFIPPSRLPTPPLPGLIQMDVMADTMCVQRSKLEPEAHKGRMQANCYSIRFAGSLVGAIGTYCYGVW
ncbi:hypothetical protein EON63_16390 [archaeon]|nr:MAG: hypothetical protein EON63_16390 [archaeon]